MDVIEQGGVSKSSKVMMRRAQKRESCCSTSSMRGTIPLRSSFIVLVFIILKKHALEMQAAPRGQMSAPTNAVGLSFTFNIDYIKLGCTSTDPHFSIGLPFLSTL